MPAHVQVSETVAQRLREAAAPDLVLVPRGEIEVKNRGRLSTYWLLPAPEGAEARQPSEGGKVSPAPRLAVASTWSMQSFLIFGRSPTGLLLLPVLLPCRRRRSQCRVQCTS